MSFSVLKHIRDQFKVNVLAVEYPGYGLLRDLRPSEDGVYEVALTAFRYLVDEINVRYSQIILFGRSLGSGPATFLAAQYPVGGLILVSPFSSIKAAVQSIVGSVIAWGFVERFPNSKIISNVSCSTLFIHGESDGLIPAEHSLRLFKRCRARKLLITPPKMEHNSNLFGDASFLAVPAIHFFGFPGYYTSNPPRLPAERFELPDIRSKDNLSKQQKEVRASRNPCLCDCLAVNDPHHMDVSFCRQEQSMEDITIRFGKSNQTKNLMSETRDTADFPFRETAEATEEVQVSLEGDVIDKARIQFEPSESNGSTNVSSEQSASTSNEETQDSLPAGVEHELSSESAVANDQVWHDNENGSHSDEELVASM